MRNGICKKCNEEKPIVGRGLCTRCYPQEKKAGTLDNWKSLNKEERADE